MKSNIFDINNVELEVGQKIKFWKHVNLSKEIGFRGTVYKDSMVLVEGEIIFEHGSYCIRAKDEIISIRDYFINTSDKITKLYKGIDNRGNLMEFLTLGDFFDKSLSKTCARLYKKYRSIYQMLTVSRSNMCDDDRRRLQEAGDEWNLFWNKFGEFIDTKIKQIEVL